MSSVCGSSRLLKVSQEQKSIIFYKRRTKVLSNTTGLLAFLFMTVVLFLPYSQIRIESYEAIGKLSEKHLRIHANAIQKATEGFLNRVSVSTKFLAEMATQPKLVGCNQNMVSGLIETANTLRRHENAEMGEMWVYENSSSHCTFIWNENQTMQMWHSTKTENGTFILTYFDENTTWDSFDLDAGVFVEEIANQTLPTVQANITIWTLRMNSAVSGLAYEASQMTIVASKWIDAASNVIVGTVVDLEEISEVLRDVTERIDCDYALITDDGQIVIDSFSGVIHPIAIVENDTPVFPQLSERSQFWAAFEPYISLEDGKTLTVDVNNSLFLITVDSLFASNQLSRFRVLTVFALDAQHEAVLRGSSIPIVMSIGLLFLITLGVLFVRERTKQWKKRKRMKPIKEPLSPLKGDSIRIGALGRSIESLRRLQLIYPSEAKFNAVLDAAIANLAEKKNRVFGVIECNPHQCQFCRYLVGNSHESPEKEPKGFHSWAKIRNADKYPRLGELAFDWNMHSRDPVGELLKLMSAIMRKEEFTFPALDPDAVLRFLYSFATQSCQDHVKTAHIVSSVYYLISNPYKYWIQSSIERFILILTAFLCNTDCSIVYDVADDSEFSEDTEKVWHSDASDGEQTEESSNIQMLFNILSDEDSAASRNVDFIIHLFKLIVPPVHDPLYEYVLSTVRVMLPAVQPTKQFDRLGEFSVRAESPSFSVLNTVDDRILFMESLLILGQFAPYWSDHNTMLSSCQRLTYSVLPPDTTDKTIAEFHFIHASKIVSPWISVFLHFDPLEQIVANFNANLRFWKSQM